MHGHHLDPSPLLDLELTTAPSVDPLDLGTVKQHLRYEADDQDDLIQSEIDAVTAALDGYAGTLGRCLMQQSWVLYLDRFPCGGWDEDYRRLWRGPRAIALPLSPLISVDGITYSDPTGAAQTLDPSTYVVRTGPRAEICLIPGNDWPDTNLNPRNVAIAFTAGYAAATGDPPTVDPTDVPGPIRQAMLLMIGDLFENREAVVVAESRVTQVLNPTVDNLLAPYRAYFL